MEHVTIARVPALPALGDIVHLDDAEVMAGGGGGIALAQLARGPGEIHLFTAFGDDDSARHVEKAVRSTGAHVHAVARTTAHTRDLVLITPDGQRTIFVVGKPLHPRREDPLPWDVLASCEAAYFTGDDPATLEAARAARLLVVTARRRKALIRSGVRADIVVGSAHDPREASTLADYPVQPGALVMTEGGKGGHILSAHGEATFAATPAPDVRGSYGAGDTFAGALTWYAARGIPLEAACREAARHAAAVLSHPNPIPAQIPLE